MADNYDNRAISERINVLLRMRNMTKYKLSQATGIGETTLSSYFKRNSKWGADALFNIAKYFNVSLDWIVRGEENTNQSSMQLLKESAGIRGDQHGQENAVRLQVMFNQVQGISW